METIIVLGIIVVLFVLALIWIIKNRKRGCSSGCSGCSLASKCKEYNEKGDINKEQDNK